jgi:hypothetical protein
MQRRTPGSPALPRQAGAISDDRAPALSRKLAAYTVLSAAEVAAFDQLHEDRRTVAAGRDIITEGYR